MNGPTESPFGIQAQDHQAAKAGAGLDNFAWMTRRGHDLLIWYPDMSTSGPISIVQTLERLAQAVEADGGDCMISIAIREVAERVQELAEKGSPGVMHEIDQAFYDLVVKERDIERRRVDQLNAVLDQVVGAILAGQPGDALAYARARRSDV